MSNALSQGNQNPQLQQETREAERFAKDLIGNRDLMNDYYAALKKAVDDFHGEYEWQMMNNFLTKKGYQTTFNLVVRAQSRLPMYKLYYWSGAYRVTLSNMDGSGSEQGDVLAVQAYSTSPTAQVSYGENDIIESTYDNLVLSWGTAHGFNQTEAKIAFQLTKTKGAAVRAFTGTMTIGGQQKLCVGVSVDPDSLSASEKQKLQETQSLTTLKDVKTIVGMVAQVAFIGFNLAMLYKKAQEKKTLQKELEKDPDNETLQKKEQQAAKDETELQTDAGNAVEGSADAAKDFADMPVDSYVQGSQDIAPLESDFPSLDDLPETPAGESEATDDLLSGAMSDAGYDPTEYNGSEDEDSGGGDDDDFFGNLFDETGSVPEDIPIE